MSLNVILLPAVMSPLLQVLSIRALNIFRPNLKVGLSMCHLSFFKKCSLWLCEPLAYLFQYCFDKGFMPPIWLQAYITPVYKKGSTTDPFNYRPIALTCIMCRLMENIVKGQLLSYLLNKNLISKQQHAFIVRHSTTTNLLECLHDWSVTLNAGNSVDVIYIDFRRAFDSIVFSKLLYKLQCYGICGKLLVWIATFLHGRTQCVVTENVHSSYANVISGVPQGSVLGPILFILFINDIVHECDSGSKIKLKLFADDLKLYSEIDLSNCKNSVDIQKSIDNITQWANIWQISINIEKTTVIELNNCLKASCRAYSVNNVTLSHSNPVRDLCVTVDSCLSFKEHINNIVTKSMQRCGILFRGFVSRDLLLMRKAFITYIRPILEFNTVIWNPSHKYLIDLIEHVQRRFTKRIPSISSLSYHERLAMINLESLELRRLRYNLIYYYKILNNLTPLKWDLYFKLYIPPQSSRTPLPLLQKPTKGSAKFFSSFFNRSIDCWNCLSPATRTTDSLPKFKSLLSNTDLSRFLVGECFDNV